jgi:hypothetical protein
MTEVNRIPSSGREYTATVSRTGLVWTVRLVVEPTAVHVAAGRGADVLSYKSAGGGIWTDADGKEAPPAMVDLLEKTVRMHFAAQQAKRRDEGAS